MLGRLKMGESSRELVQKLGLPSGPGGANLLDGTGKGYQRSPLPKPAIAKVSRSGLVRVPK